jgi:hypothetical protein
MKRLSVIACVVSILTLGLVTPALAAVPSNDTYAGRTVIGSLPFSETLDTTEATTDADDAEANAACFAPATDASVWYEYTATADGFLDVQVFLSDYSAGVLVVTGSPGSFLLETCGPGGVQFYAVSGQTYSIAAIDSQEDGAGNGGNLTISVSELPPGPTMDVTIDPVGRFDQRTGSATVSGTATCPADALQGFIVVQLRQPVGRFVVTGSGFTEVTCDDSPQTWTVEVTAFDGLFKGGRATVLAEWSVCSGMCNLGVVESQISLRR